MKTFIFSIVTGALALIILTLNACHTPRVGWYKDYGMSSRDELFKPSSVPNLIKALEDKDYCVRHSAARALGHIGTEAKDAVPGLINTLEDKEYRVRYYAVQALGDIGPEAKDAVPGLIKALEDKNYGNAAHALGKIGPAAEQAIPALKMLLADRNIGIHIIAAEALIAIEYSGSDLEVILRNMERRTKDDGIRNRISRALTKLIILNKNKQDAPPGMVAQKTSSPQSYAPVPLPAEVKSVPVPRGVEFGNYHALVIGINKYFHFADLQTAVNDAETVAEIFQNEYKYSVRLLLNPRRNDIVAALAELRRELSPSDNLLIYYAGHGWLDEAADEGYWLPSDATRENEANWVSNTAITASVRAMPAKHVMIVADSCYSGKLTRGIHIKRKTSDYLARMSRKKTRVVLSSGGLEPVADSDGQGKHSAFASAFINVLKENKGVMDGTGFFVKIRSLVMLATEQTPEYADIRRAGHNGGDFLFVR